MKDLDIMKSYNDLYWSILNSSLKEQEKKKILKVLNHAMDLYIASFANLFKISQSTDDTDND